MIALTDDQLKVVMAAANAVPVERRDLFLQRVGAMLRLRERIAELRDEVDENRDLIRRQREHIEDDTNYLENFIITFGLTLNDDNEYTNNDFLMEHIQLGMDVDSWVDKYNDLVRTYNAMLDDYNRRRGMQRPVGRPIAASEAQQTQALAYHKDGKSMRWIAESMTLSRRTVSTIIDKGDGNDRTTIKRRIKYSLPLEKKPKRRKWSINRLPKQATALVESARELDKEARGLGSSRNRGKA